MNVAISSADPRIHRVWYDVAAGKLCVETAESVNSIPFEEIGDEDFESRAPVCLFSVGIEGTMVVCHHADGAETWLPADMWLPGGFTPRGKFPISSRDPLL